MVEFSDDTPKGETTTAPSGKKQVDFFAAVRERGMLNASLETLSKKYEEGHPGEATKWETFRPGEDGGTDMVMFREGQGYKAVRHEELFPEGSATSVVPKDGLVRRGDAILMAAPREVHNQILLQDAQAAHDDLKAPQHAFEENLRQNTVKTSDGTIESAKPFGKITKQVEDIPKVASGENV